MRMFETVASTVLGIAAPAGGVGVVVSPFGSLGPRPSRGGRPGAAEAR